MTSPAAMRSSSASSPAVSSQSRMRNSPEERLSQLRLHRLPSGRIPASTLSRSAGSSPSSVSVPGVTMRVTRRSTGPRRLAAGSPICSQMATVRPILTSLTRYASTLWNGTPHMGMGCPADCPRAVRVMSSRRDASLGVVVEQLVRNRPSGRKSRALGVLRLDATAYSAHHWCVGGRVRGVVHRPPKDCKRRPRSACENARFRRTSRSGCVIVCGRLPAGFRAGFAGCTCIQRLIEYTVRGIRLPRDARCRKRNGTGTAAGTGAGIAEGSHASSQRRKQTT